MKYQNTITIKVPINRCIELLDNPDNMKHWQKGLQSYELLSGEPGAVGSKMQLNFLQGKRNLTLIETVIQNDFPHTFNATYECKGVWNLVENHFSENEEGHTVWVSDNEFKFNGMMKIMSWFMPTSMFKKQSCAYLEDFKTFAESQ